MAKAKKSKKTRNRIFLLGFSSIAIILFTTITIGKYWVEIIDKYQEKRELKTKLVSLKEKQDVLESDAKKLQDPDYIARYAREKYLYSKDGEIILNIQ